jgi:hypothetical protein
MGRVAGRGRFWTFTIEAASMKVPDVRVGALSSTDRSVEVGCTRLPGKREAASIEPGGGVAAGAADVSAAVTTTARRASVPGLAQRIGRR